MSVGSVWRFDAVGKVNVKGAAACGSDRPGLWVTMPRREVRRAPWCNPTARGMNVRGMLVRMVWRNVERSTMDV